MSGPAIVLGPDGDKLEFNYEEGKINGRGVYYAINGSASEERTYVEGVMHGPATLHLANGDTEVGRNFKIRTN